MDHSAHKANLHLKLKLIVSPHCFGPKRLQSLKFFQNIRHSNNKKLISHTFNYSAIGMRIFCRQEFQKIYWIKNHPFNSLASIPVKWVEDRASNAVKSLKPSPNELKQQQSGLHATNGDRDNDYYELEGRANTNATGDAGNHDLSFDDDDSDRTSFFGTLKRKLGATFGSKKYTKSKLNANNSRSLGRMDISTMNGNSTLKAEDNSPRVRLADLKVEKVTNEEGNEQMMSRKSRRSMNMSQEEQNNTIRGVAVIFLSLNSYFFLS